MAITGIFELESRATQSEGNAKGYTSVFRIETTSKDFGIPEVFREFNQQRVRTGQRYEFNGSTDATVEAVRIDIERLKETRAHLHATVNYSTPSFERNQNGKDRNGKPTKDPSRWAKTIQTSQRKMSIVAEKGTLRFPALLGIGPKARRKDTIGPVENAAHEVFDPPTEDELIIRVIRITGYSFQFPFQTDAHVGTINSDQFDIRIFAPFMQARFAPYTVLMDSVNVSQAKVNGFDVFKVAVELHHLSRPDHRGIELGWRREFLNQGFSMTAARGMPDGRGGYFGNSNSVTSPEGAPASVRVTDAYGNPISKPVNLDHRGVVADGIYAFGPTYIIYSIKNETRFRRLKLGD